MKLSELKKYIEENIVEILDEGSQKIVATPSNEEEKTVQNDPKIQQKKAVIKTLQASKPGDVIVATTNEAKDEDEEVEDTYGKEDEDDKKDAKIKAAKPTKDQLKKNASIATITDALAKATKEFKETNEMYKKAEGKEKAKFLAKLKDLTPKIQTLKKALEKKEEALK